MNPGRMVPLSRQMGAMRYAEGDGGFGPEHFSHLYAVVSISEMNLSVSHVSIQS